MSTTATDSGIDQAAIAKAAQTQAAGQVQSELATQIDPISAQIGGLQRDEGRAVAGVGSLFKSLQPTVDQGAQRVQSAYGDAEKVQSQILSAANAAMSQLKQSRAQEAQMLAQEIGGPVALGEFTEGMDSAASALVNLGAGSQLHTLGVAQAGVQAANAFSGQVFPLLRTEQTAKARTFYEDQVKDLRTKITDLRAQAPGQIHQRFNEIQAQKLDFEMKQAQFKLDALNSKRDYDLKVQEDAQAKIKADRDWQQGQEQLKAARAQTEATIAGLTGTYHGKPTLEAQKLSADERRADAADKRAATQLGITQQEFQLQKRQLDLNAKLAKAKLKADAAVTANAYIDAGTSPQPGKTVTETHSVPVATFAAESGKVKDAYKDPSSPTGYSRLVTVVNTESTQPITDPNDLVDYLVAHGVGKTLAVNRVKARLHLSSDWEYGDVAAVAGASPLAPPTRTTGGAKSASLAPDLTGGDFSITNTPGPGRSTASAKKEITLGGLLAGDYLPKTKRRAKAPEARIPATVSPTKPVNFRA